MAPDLDNHLTAEALMAALQSFGPMTKGRLAAKLSRTVTATEEVLEPLLDAGYVLKHVDRRCGAEVYLLSLECYGHRGYHMLAISGLRS